MWTLFSGYLFLTKVSIWGGGKGLEVGVATEALFPFLKGNSSMTALSGAALTLWKIPAPA